MLWALRAGWLLLPIAAGPAIAHGLDGTSTPVQVVAVAMCWLAWTIAFVAVLVPRTVSLTALRIGAPAALGVAVWVSARSDVGPWQVIAMASTAMVAGFVLFLPQFTDAFVDGSSYGPERRMALRTPGMLLLGPVELTWAATVAGLVAGPLLLAAKQWIAGAIVTVAGAIVARFGVRALHRLSRRWLVFVPAGVVLHDHLVLGEAVLYPKQTVTSLSPAEVGTSARDATGRALGLVLELRADTDGVLFSPVRPGALLQEARARGLATSPPPSTTSPS